ncbi:MULTISPECIES: inner membrane protein YpjD [unclassified Thioalkalivibrio]|uniref:cytochrome C assembly family protein n=1 Tax=unclassified Thioalkalivibrio TaxID=2621013 RepID=UPI00035E59C1|nr:MULTISPECIES: cytochrome c biogenesis protein CcsA [unclassified Thioalkalivibrio]
MTTVAGLLAVALYLATTGYLIVASRTQPLAAGQPRAPLMLWLAALLAHLGALIPLVATETGLNLCLGNALSASMWLVAGLLWLTALRHPLAVLGVVILPLTALATLTAVLCDGDTSYATSAGIDLHILFSALGWAFLALSTAQAAVMTAQHRALHNHHTAGIVRHLPPLFSMEVWLFRMIFIGWLFLGLSLLSGLVFVDDLFAQHLVHKTVLSLLAWVIFSTLLVGRWRLGWRGTRALAWTTGGFVALVLAYFGSKLVLEIILGRV